MYAMFVGLLARSVEHSMNIQEGSKLQRREREGGQGEREGWSGEEGKRSGEERSGTGEERGGKESGKERNLAIVGTMRVYSYVRCFPRGAGVR